MLTQQQDTTLAERARHYRLALMPDRRVGMTTFNGAIRRGHTKVAVADRACELLRAELLAYPAKLVEQMCAIAYLVGVLDVPVSPQELVEQGFPVFVAKGVQTVHGRKDDSTYLYYETLMENFEAFKLVKGALHIAELEEVSTLPFANRRRRKVYGECEPVRIVLGTAPGSAPLLRLLYAAQHMPVA